MAEAGADIIVCHLGLTTGGAIGAQTGRKLADCPALIDEWAAAALRGQSKTVVLVHGGPVSRAGGRRIHLASTADLPRLLRRLLDGAPADRTRWLSRPAIQSHRLRPNLARREKSWARKLSESLILWLIVLAIIVVIAVYLLRWLYRRSTKETAFVRTGLGGEKVVISGGAFVVPVVHDITPVNMNVMRIEVCAARDTGSDHQEPDARRCRSPNSIVKVGSIARGGEPSGADARPPNLDRTACANCSKDGSPPPCGPPPRR